ncbi:hypothetical protein [Desulfosporosinus youngiae]|uniref:Uncharacterized protein n=1 Tax=Desulfosporosinus youngiae DSM 17734 TaxID=768710 RepID=H5Y3G3_9FIRM|nr:hypothetical protein [Desulfosporosinus youngiae]EHQ89072.1 hypothetical protein DesyoDRAFT_1966 [Desulfosporosinus youngiae DSM 17734]
MKNRFTFKLIALGVLAVALISLAVFMKPMPKVEPEQYVKEKYSDNSEYSNVLHTKNGSYEAILGEDQEKVYMELFRDGEYFGGKTIVKDTQYSVDVYQFQQYEVLQVVCGYNQDAKFASYKLKLSGTSAAGGSVCIQKEIKEDKYILDIYSLDTRYIFTGDLELIKS